MIEMEEQLYELALFAGAGGGLLATKHLFGWRTICYVENATYPVEVIKARIRDGYLDDAPIWDDANTFDGHPWTGLVDVITAGFPCQPFSQAGKGLAEKDPRNGWPATIRIIREVRPRFALLENVPNLLSKPYARTIFGELAEAGYDARWDCISAEEIGANHKRERLWVVAYAVEQQGNMAELSRQESIQPAGDGAASEMAYPDNPAPSRQQKHGRKIFPVTKTERLDLGSSALSDAKCDGLEKSQNKQSRQQIEQGNWWSIEPGLGRVADGVAHRVDRLRAIGNGQVPAVVRSAWERLAAQIENELT